MMQDITLKCEVFEHWDTREVSMPVYVWEEIPKAEKALDKVERWLTFYGKLEENSDDLPDEQYEAVFNLNTRLLEIYHYFDDRLDALRGLYRKWSDLEDDLRFVLLMGRDEKKIMKEAK